jgi:predicted membrane protein
MNQTKYEPRVLIRRIEHRKPTPLTMLTHGLASVVLVPSYALAAAAIGAPASRCVS